MKQHAVTGLKNADFDMENKEHAGRQNWLKMQN